MKYWMQIYVIWKIEFIQTFSFFQNFELFKYFMIQFSWKSIDLYVFVKQSNLMFYLIIWCNNSIFVRVFNLINLTFFHVFFCEFLDIFHHKHYFSIFELIDSFFNRVFIKFNLIEVHSWLELIISEKWKYLRDYRNKNVENVLSHK
jgi:hypothetical protein